ncbi:hypothetical protein Droror1_Dr00015166 [Drosera rotundifolia]
MFVDLLFFISDRLENNFCSRKCGALVGRTVDCSPRMARMLPFWEHGGDVNAADRSTQTALHGGDVLVHNGARVEAMDLNGCRVNLFVVWFLTDFESGLL